MIAQGMLWMAATAALLALAARALEDVLRSYGMATRWVWVGALILSAALPAVSYVTGGAFPGSLLPRAAETVDLAALFDGEVVLVEDGLAAAAGGSRLDGVERVLAVAWPAASLVVFALYALTWLRLARSRRVWRPTEIAGTRVLLSARGGPAVLGLIRPSIVVPVWLREESAEAQRMILLHEREHVRAGDHALLALAPLFVIAMPWNVALWWQLRRLRLCIEVDCDRRVLAHGVAPGSYGALLLDIARRGGPALGGAAALAEPRTFLERRILAMSSTIPKLRLPRALAFTAFAVVLALAACETTMPMNVSTPEPQPSEPPAAATVIEAPIEVLPKKMAAAEPLIVLNDVIVDGTVRELVESLGSTVSPERIEEIEVVKGEAAAKLYGSRAEGGVIRIRTKDGGVASGELTEVAVRKLEAERAVESEKASGAVLLRRRAEAVAAVRALSEVETVEVEKNRADAAGVVAKLRVRSLEEAAAQKPLLVVDGVIVQYAALDQLGIAHDRIERIEVMKGGAAAALYGARAAHGLIMITTKK